VRLRLCAFILLLGASTAWAQTGTQGNPAPVNVGSPSDTLTGEHPGATQVAPLDVARDRGLFIVTPDQRLQMRIIGSIRLLIVYDNDYLASKNTLNTVQIPTDDDNQRQPSYFNGLDQTRLGFEVTRQTSRGPVFARLETDFAGTAGFRIRHAYGQYSWFLFGQTWSLFSQITALPATVDFSGPTGSVVPRTPQVRYTFGNPVLGMNLAVALEYHTPDLSLPDSSHIKAFQLAPSPSARIDRAFDWGNLQLSGVLPVLSGQDAQGDLHVKTGWGVAASAVLKTWSDSKWYVMGVGGEGITSLITGLDGTGQDFLIGPDGRGVSPFALGGYVTYEQPWNSNVYSSLSYGMVQVEKLSFTPDDEYHRGVTLRLDTFWDPVEGTKLGGEVIWGEREDKDGSRGNALRFNMLTYYDF